MLEKILEAIGGRSKALADQADTIERLEAQIKESNNEKDLAVADLRKVERLAKQSGDKLRERVSKLTSENKDLTSENKKLEAEAKRAEGLEKALAESEANLTVSVKENESLKAELATAVAEREEHSAALDEAIEALQNIGESLGISEEEKDNG